MKLSLPVPAPDAVAYEERLRRGFDRFPKRKANFCKYKASKRDSVALDYLPVKMDYEVTSRCNFRCSMCRVSEWKDGKRAEDMSLEDFKNSLDQLYSLVEIKLQGLGEPLLNPHIFDMIRYAGERDIWTRITVNGSLLHVNENFKRLIDADPGEVQISIDGADKEVFERIRRGSQFDKVMANAALINKYAGSRNVFKTRSWTVVQQANMHQLEDVVRLSNKVGFKRMTFCLAMSDFGLERWADTICEIGVTSQMSAEKATRLMDLGKSLGTEVTFWYSSNKYSVSYGKAEPCPWLFERAFISSDMRIVPCCVLSSPDIADFGDAREFVHNWNGSIYKKFRKAHLDGMMPNYCKNCYM